VLEGELFSNKELKPMEKISTHFEKIFEGREEDGF
jgi:hypothetical protein